MAGAPIAEGVVIVTADAKDVPRDVARDIDSGQENVKESGNRTGRNLFAGITKWAVGTVAVVGGTIGTLALKGGFDRALNIQEATKKLEGLGHDTQSISSIMNSALNSVRGTAFGLGSAATVSAGLVASGVALGDELERRLKTVADTATISGRSIEDVGLIFQSVAAKGKLQGDDLLQLMSAGIPVLQFLAEHYGVTAEEASEMVSRGEVDFANFADAMEENIGGAAMRSGETARGALSNVFAALSRIGEGIAAPIVAAAPGLFQAIAGALDEVDIALGPVADKFAEWLTPAIENLSAWIDRVDWTKVTEGVLAFSPFANVVKILEPLLPILSDMGDRILPVLATAWEEISEALAPVIPMLTEALVDAIIELADPVTDLVEALVPLIPPLIDLALVALPPLIDLLEILVDMLGPNAEGLADFASEIGAMLSFLTGNTTFEEFSKQMQDSLGPIGAFGDFLWDVSVIIGDAINAIGGWFIWLDQTIIQPLVTAFLIAFGIVAGIMTWLYDTAIAPIIAAIGNTFTWLQVNIIAPIASAIQTTLNILGAVFTWLYQNAIKPAFDGIATAFQWVYNTIIAPIANAISGAMQGAGDTSKKAFGGVGDFIGAAFRNALSVVKGPINGIISLVNQAIRGLNGLSVTIPAWVPQVGGQTWGLSIPTIPMLARGGVTRTSGRVMVGEQGPEYLDLPRGAQVTPLNRTDALPGGGGEKLADTINIYEAEDPLGTTGRLGAEWRKWRKGA